MARPSLLGLLFQNADLTASTERNWCATHIHLYTRFYHISLILRPVTFFAHFNIFEIGMWLKINDTP